MVSYVWVRISEVSYMIVSIHQPNFLPWSTFFEKVSSADVFVVMGDCQYEKNGYQNRFNIGEKWYTMSVARGMIPINKKKYTNAQGDWETIKRKLPDYRAELELFEDCISEDLYETNYGIIKKAAKMLGIETKIVKDEKTGLTATDRLVRLCQIHNATTYISGPSGRDYLDMAAFEKAGVSVRFSTASKGAPLIKELKHVV